MANTLIDLPNEILHNILKYVDPRDLGQIFMVCQQLHKFIDDMILFKEVYCMLLDEPVADFKPANFDYKEELRHFCQARRAATNNLPAGQKRQDLVAVARFITGACQISTAKNAKSLEYMKEWFGDTGRGPNTERENAEAFLCQSNTFYRARHQDNDLSPLSFTDRQASAKLHCYYGVPIFLPRRRKWKTTYPYAVSVVYDLRNYNEETLWGPYLGDGQASVDWEKMEAVMLVLGHNMRAFTRQTHGMFPKFWTEPFEGINPDSYVDDGKYHKAKREDLDRKQKLWETEGDLVRYPVPDGLVDPYNITGTWTRVVCFLDFHDLFAYNFTTGQPAANQPRPPLNTTEAIRLITMEIRATKSEAPGPNDGQGFPIIHFEGISKSSMNSSWDPNANSSIRGTVRMTTEGEVRWQTISVYAGEERWASEGIQVGGIRSGRGVIGHWFDKDHDIHGPAGPTAFWKTSDGFRDYDDENQTGPLYSQNTANVQYTGDEDEDEEEILEEDEEIFELNGVTASDLVTELELSGHTTAAQLHDVLTQIVMGHLQQHQNQHHHHHHDEEEDEAEQSGSPEDSGGEASHAREAEAEEHEAPQA